MNKLIKGAVTGAAGIALLLGGAGTFAAWNASTSIAAGKSINTGKLSIDAVSNAKWFDINDKTGASSEITTTIDDYVFAPGDHVQLTEDLTLTATGNNLEASLAATLPASLKDKGFTVAAALTPATTASNIRTDDGGKTYTVTTTDGAATTLTVPVTVDITFDGTTQNELADGSSSMSQNISLSDVTIDLKQVNPATY
jgi:alternate signal-mediated exported protein